jgi:hypothetical protein
MRNLNSALPFPLFFFVIIFVGRLTQIRPYQELTENLSAGRAADSKREIVRAMVIGLEDEVLVAGRGTADFLTNGASVADLPETADEIVLDVDPPLTVDTTGAALVALSSAVVGGKERTVVRAGDVVTVFGRRGAAGSLRADIISALPPAELYNDRLRSAVRVLVGGLGMFAAFFMLPPLARFLSRFASEIRRDRASRRRRAELRERGECPACQPSAARGFIACVECGRALERGPQLREIRESLQALHEGSALLLSAMGPVSASLRFRRQHGMKLEIRSADVSVADARAVRHVLSRVGARVALEPGPIWIINFDDSVGRAAAAAHGIFQEVYRLDPDYSVETRRLP